VEDQKTEPLKHRDCIRKCKWRKKKSLVTGEDSNQERKCRIIRVRGGRVYNVEEDITREIKKERKRKVEIRALLSQTCLTTQEKLNNWRKAKTNSLIG